jgi:hypothetical protein
MALIVFGLALVVVLVVSVVQLRRGGQGPRMGWIPRSWRPKANDAYRQHGWRPPFDEQGEHR